MPHKSFGRTEENTEPVEPISFDFADEEGLGCRTEVNGNLLLTCMADVESGSTTRQAKGITEVFDIVLLRDDGDDPEAYTGRDFNPDKPFEHHTRAELATAREEGVTPGVDPTSSLGRLRTVLHDPNTAFQIKDLAEVVTWLVESLTGNPTPSASTSGRGGRSTGRSSKRTRQPRALTSVAADSDSPST